MLNGHDFILSVITELANVYESSPGYSTTRVLRIYVRYNMILLSSMMRFEANLTRKFGKYHMKKWAYSNLAN